MTREDRPTIKVFRAADVPALKAMIHRTIAACYPSHYSPEAVRFFLDYHSEQAIRDDAGAGHTLVLDRGGRTLGTGTLLGDEIRRVFVDPAFQKQGLGRLIMQRLEEIAAAATVTVVKLDASLPSKAFYDRLGYVTIEPAFHPLEGGGRLDYLSMQKVLATLMESQRE
jgi:GNAT superfamily N-acetyltransferase